jgi:hypothetical protein
MLNSISIIPNAQNEVASSAESMSWDAFTSMHNIPTHGNRARTYLSTASKFFAELKRRKVYKVAVAYVVVSWLLIQAASIFLPTFDAPPCMMKAVVVFLALGFVLSSVLSWVFDITPQGIKRTPDISSDDAVDIVRRLKAQARQEFVRGYLSALIYAGQATKRKRLIALNANSSITTTSILQKYESVLCSTGREEVHASRRSRRDRTKTATIKVTAPTDVR